VSSGRARITFELEGLSVEGQVQNSNQIAGKFTLHPLIHTLLKFNLAQDFEKKKSGAKNSAFS